MVIFLPDELAMGSHLRKDGFAVLRWGICDDTSPSADRVNSSRCWWIFKLRPILRLLSAGRIHFNTKPPMFISANNVASPIPDGPQLLLNLATHPPIPTLFSAH
jgi:hypothetical protein